MFVLSESSGDVEILDFGFNGWGYDAAFRKDNRVPLIVGEDLGMPVTNYRDVVLEGGAIEVEGRGTLMATRSSVLKNERNPFMSQVEMEDVMHVRYYGH